MENRASLLSEFWSFLKQNKKWWLIPLLLVILLFVALAIFPDLQWRHSFILSFNRLYSSLQTRIDVQL